ncbi:MAG: glycosyltransferase family 2 protein [Chloroflexi bacterium]|nr:glycosyltransferase family 2 protein [Chloroflexota bacterium]
MSIVLLTVTIGALALSTLVAAIGAYLLLLTIAACCARRTTAPRQGPPTSRFVIMVPAHNEEKLLPHLLASCQALDYPRALFQVHVVADNCSDGTAAVARAAGASVHERCNTEQRGKGYALQWLLERLWASGEPHDAVVIVDADSDLSPNFLRVMDARLVRGERVIQGYYAVRDPEHAASAAIRAVALIVLHYVRPLGRMVLGGSAGLKGNGMVFAAELLRAHRWTASLTEDIEYHMALILAGERAMFAPDAVVKAEMPGSLRAAQTQNERWERGRIEMIRRFVPQLLCSALRQRRFLLFDAAVEQLIPPFAVLSALTLLALALALLAAHQLALGLGLFALTAQIVYVATGLILVRAPGTVYRALLFTPLFLVWKIWLYIRILLGLKPARWIRTARNEE